MFCGLKVFIALLTHNNMINGLLTKVIQPSIGYIIANYNSVTHYTQIQPTFSSLITASLLLLYYHESVIVRNLALSERR